MTVTLLLAGGCTTAPQTDTGKKSLEAQAADTLDQFKKESPSSSDFYLKSAKGYAVFPSVGKGGVGIGGAYGRGVLYVGGKVVGYCTLSQATIGFQLGGQAFSEIVFLETDQMVQRFRGGSVEFSAQASAVAAKAGKTATNDYQHGVAVFVIGEKGLMYEAAIGGQAFSYQAK
jgi:lipid-binding SYLF domain-containing protein